jgi:hypothetical protein
MTAKKNGKSFSQSQFDQIFIFQLSERLLEKTDERMTGRIICCSLCHINVVIVQQIKKVSSG